MNVTKNCSISIIVPVYNTNPKLLKKCINSILQQTFNNFECILVNDGSTKKQTTEVCRIYAKKDKRIKYFEKANEGLELTRKYGIDKAECDFIMFLDSDDYYEKNAFEKLYNTAIKDGSDIVVANSYYQYLSWLPCRTKQKVQIIKNIAVNQDAFLNEYYQNFFGCNKFVITTWNKIFKASLLKNKTFHSFRYGKWEDIVLNSQVFPTAEKISFITDFLYTQLYGGMSTNYGGTKKFDAIYMCNAYFNLYDFRVKLLQKYNVFDTHKKWLIIELKNIILFCIDKMIETKVSEEEIINNLKTWRQTKYFELISEHCAGKNPIISLMENNEFLKIAEERTLAVKKKYFVIKAKRILRKILYFLMTNK